jgi:hypothetical protein
MVLSCAVQAHAQDDILRDITVSDTRLEGFTFAVDYFSPPEHDDHRWAVGDHLISIHRATIDEGTITVRAELYANAESRLAFGRNSVQGISIGFGPSTFVFNSGPASELVAVEYSFPWNKTKLFSYPPFVKLDIDISGIAARCGDVLGGRARGCGIRRTVVILPATAAITINGLERPRPVLVARRTHVESTQYLDVQSMGLNPFAEWQSLALDGAVLQKVAFKKDFGTPAPGTWYRYPERTGDPAPDGDPRRGDPLRPEHVRIAPSAGGNVGLDTFLCDSGCGYHAARFGLPENLSTGLHTVTLATGPYASGSASFYDVEMPFGAAGAASQPLTVNFIVYAPLAELSAPQAHPGEKITVRGSGFAPSSKVRFTAEIPGRGSTPFPLGAPVATDVTGSFAVELVLPPLGRFYADLVELGRLPGEIRVDVDDVPFLAYYFGGIPQFDEVDITFLAPGTVTSTTLPPGSECVRDEACADLDPCTEDRCINGRCSNVLVTGVAAVTCASPPGGLAQPEYTEAVPQSAVRQYDKGDDLLELAAAFGAEDLARKVVRKKVKKLVKKAIKKFDKAERIVTRAGENGVISEEFADVLVGVIQGVSDRARDVLDTL